MGALSALIGVVFLVYLLLRIVRMLDGGPRTPSVAPQGPPELPKRSEAEIETLLESMPTKWVAYEGMTPPLELKIRGLTYELWRRFARHHLDQFGQHTLDALPVAEAAKVSASLLPNINDQAYVLDWRGMTYPNGNPLPYTSENLATLMRKDEFLMNFVSKEAEKLSPDWDAERRGK